MQVFEGYIENGQFRPIGLPRIAPEWNRALLTVLDEPIKLTEIEERKAFWAAFDKLAQESADEDELLNDEAFSRRPSGRELVVFSDEERAI